MVHVESEDLVVTVHDSGRGIFVQDQIGAMSAHGPKADVPGTPVRCPIRMQQQTYAGRGADRSERHLHSLMSQNLRQRPVCI